MLDLAGETRSLLRMIHGYQLETMKSHEYRKAQLDCYCEENDYFLQRIEAAHKKLNPVSQSVEESKTAQRVEES